MSLLAAVKLAEAAEYRHQHVQDLSKHRTDATKESHMALEGLANSQDELYLGKPILTSDLVLHAPFNRKSKLHPSWNGPIVDSTEKDVYQLATANGHIIVDVKRLCKLNVDRCNRHTSGFWDPSDQLKLHDECT